MNNNEIVYESYINGQRKQMVEQMDNDIEIANFLSWVQEHYGSEKSTEIAIIYFRIKGR